MAQEGGDSAAAAAAVTAAAADAAAPKAAAAAAAAAADGANGAGVTEAQLRREAEALLKTVDVATASLRSVREELERRLGVPLAAHAAFLKATVTELLTAAAAAAAAAAASSGGGGGAKARAAGPRKALPAALAALLGVQDAGTFFELTKLVHVYLREHSLKDPRDGRYYQCDDALQRAFRVRRFHMFHLGKLLKGAMDGSLGEDVPIVESSDVMFPKGVAADAKAANGSGGGGGSSSSKRSSGGGSSAPKRAAAAAPKKAARDDAESSDESDGEDSSAAEDSDAQPKKASSSGGKGSGGKSGGGKSGSGRDNLVCPEGLRELVGKPYTNFFELTKFLHQYIREHGLKDPSNGHYVLADERLRDVFKVGRFKYFHMGRLLKKAAKPWSYADEHK